MEDDTPSRPEAGPRCDYVVWILPMASLFAIVGFILYVLWGR